VCVCVWLVFCPPFVYTRRHKIEAKMDTVTLSKRASYKMEKYLYKVDDAKAPYEILQTNWRRVLSFTLQLRCLREKYSVP
jgi:hypothetical protein